MENNETRNALVTLPAHEKVIAGAKAVLLGDAGVVGSAQEEGLWGGFGEGGGGALDRMGRRKHHEPLAAALFERHRAFSGRSTIF